MVGVAVTSGNGPRGQCAFIGVNGDDRPPTVDRASCALRCMLMPGRTSGLALILVAVALPGCGGSNDTTTTTPPPQTVKPAQSAVLDTIDALQTASRHGDGLRICNQVFTKNLVRSIEASAKRECNIEVRKRLFTPEESIAVQQGIVVKGNTATAVIREQNGNVSTLHLLKQKGRWRIDRVVAQKPAQS